MIKPEQNYLLLEPIVKNISGGGILLLNSIDKTTSRGTVLVENDSFKVGNVVVYPSYEGCRILEDKKDYVLLPKDKVIARIE